jgi:hypothetical protein
MLSKPTDARATTTVVLADLPHNCADVIRNPQAFAHLPALRQDAWMAAKEAQGNPITPERMARLPLAVPAWSGNVRPLPPRDTKEPAPNSVEALIATVTGRTRARIRKHATSQGYHLICTDTPGGAV